ncbi:MAG: penicillin-binding protein 2 [Candidatus Magasanikbacteria bacterium]|nr:penicillin-binding protein 2 [Candidatus Magasanikbacteria bacterium]
MHWRNRKSEGGRKDRRLAIVGVFFLFWAFLIIGRLFFLQVIEHGYYALFAENTHEIKAKLAAHRGNIYWQDTRVKKELPAAVNRDYYTIYAVPREILSSEVASTSARVIEILGVTSTLDQENIFSRLANSKSYYAPLVKKADEALAEAIKNINLPGIYTTPQEYRFYPEGSLGGNVLGFVGANENGDLVGRYGLEQYFEKKIAGRGGFMAGDRGALGGWINIGKRTTIKPENGVDLLLTIDRTLEFKACERLKQGMNDYEAVSGVLILMEVKTGAVRALCSFPDFDPNNYSKVENVESYNNTAVSTQYEPGSVFKPVTMAGALDQNLVNPGSTFTDPCSRVINGYTIKNAQNKCYGVQTMTQVLENSVNTGMIWVEERLGREKFKNYVDKFGFGKRTGIALSNEVAGDVSALEKPGAIFGAVGAFGQGLTATPLQIATAYAAIANGGALPKPYIVEEVRYGNGRIEKTSSETTEQVIEPRSSRLLLAMLTSVVENHYTRAKIPGYYVAGKTGTAQIPGKGGYTEETNHTFAGFAPATSPELVLVVKFEKPKQRWAEQTALYVFQDVLEYALNYYGFPRDKK